MSVGIWDFEIKQGATFSHQLTVNKNGALWNLSGCQARMQIRTDRFNTLVIALTSLPAAGLTLGGAAGTIDIVISATSTSGIDFDNAKYDLEVEDADGVVVCLLEGDVTLNRNITV